MAELDVSIAQLLTAANDSLEFQTVTDEAPDEIAYEAFPAFIVHTETVFDPVSRVAPFDTRMDGEWEIRVEIILNYDSEIDSSPTAADMLTELKRLRRAWFSELDTNVNTANDDTPFYYDQIRNVMGYYGSIKVYSTQITLIRHTREDL